MAESAKSEYLNRIHCSCNDLSESRSISFSDIASHMYTITGLSWWQFAALAMDISQSAYVVFDIMCIAPKLNVHPSDTILRVIVWIESYINWYLPAVIGVPGDLFCGVNIRSPPSQDACIRKLHAFWKPYILQTLYIRWEHWAPYSSTEVLQIV